MPGQLSSIVPPDPRDAVAAKIKDLQRQIDELRNANVLAAATIGAGGLVVKDEGSITVDGGSIDIASGGTLSVDGSATVGGTLGVTGGATISGDLNVTTDGKITIGSDSGFTNPIVLQSAASTGLASINLGAGISSLSASETSLYISGPHDGVYDPELMFWEGTFTFQVGATTFATITVQPHVTHPSIVFNDAALFNTSSELRAMDETGAAYVPVRASSFPTSSSRSVKDNIADIPFDALAAIRAAKAQQWSYKPEFAAENGLLHIGPMADDLPASMVAGEGDARSVDTLSMIGVLWQAATQQADTIDALTQRVTTLETALTALTARVAALETPKETA